MAGRAKGSTRALRLTSKLLTKPPPPPKTLGLHGRAYWKRIAPLLVERQVLGELHLEAFEALCDWWDIYQTKKIYLQKNPSREFFVTESGYEQRSPVAIARERAYENLLKLWPRFGLTPEAAKKFSGSGSGGNAPEQASPLADFAAEKYGSE